MAALTIIVFACLRIGQHTAPLALEYLELPFVGTVFHLTLLQASTCTNYSRSGSCAGCSARAWCNPATAASANVA
jgi:hypothetical protein